MSEAPERIWAFKGNARGWDYGNFVPKFFEHLDDSGVEYIRADLVPQWQPIETAPKDNTKVLLFVPVFGPSIGYFDAHGPDNLWCVRGIVNRGVQPTHWMPLPEPPTTE